jgi:hypothetical protein
MRHDDDMPVRFDRTAMLHTCLEDCQTPTPVACAHLLESIFTPTGELMSGSQQASDITIMRETIKAYDRYVSAVNNLRHTILVLKRLE